ncbi:MAG TPA: hypothetical protein PK858_06880, partial [Saprospiraceae bacterium]|nr:hypothetical protein [Saprospiraceae bacterium]
KQWLPPEAAGQWRGTDFLSPAALARRVASLRLSPPLSASLAYREAQTRHAAADWALEDAQNRQVFNFLQLAYQDPVVTPDRPKKFNAFNNFSARVALALPMPGNNNPKRSEAALQLREAEVSAQTARLLLEKNLELQQVRIDNLLDQQRICQAKIDSSLIRKMLDNPALCAQMSPLELADLQLAQQKLRVRGLEIEQELFGEYLRLLEWKGVLGQEPIRNYLGLQEF